MNGEPKLLNCHMISAYILRNQYSSSLSSDKWVYNTALTVKFSVGIVGVVEDVVEDDVEDVVEDVVVVVKTGSVGVVKTGPPNGFEVVVVAVCNDF